MQTALLKLAAKLRRERTVTPERMASQREEFREEYIKLLGIDTCREVFGVGAPEAERTAVGNDEFCKIERMALKLCDGVTFTGLLLTPHRRAARTPFVIMSHGGFYTLYTMTCDVRLKSGWSAAFFNDRTKY